MLFNYLIMLIIIIASMREFPLKSLLGYYLFIEGVNLNILKYTIKKFMEIIFITNIKIIVDNKFHFFDNSKSILILCRDLKDALCLKFRLSQIYINKKKIKVSWLFTA